MLRIHHLSPLLDCSDQGIGHATAAPFKQFENLKGLVGVFTISDALNDVCLAQFRMADAFKAALAIIHNDEVGGAGFEIELGGGHLFSPVDANQKTPIRRICQQANCAILVLTAFFFSAYPLRMTLDQYMKSKGMTNADFGVLIDRPAETVRRYRLGLRWPDRDTMQKIARASGGAVKPNDFVPALSKRTA